MKALLLVDIQNDFCPGGALPVPGGDGVVPLANRLQERFGLVILTQDWHPADHLSFASQHRRRPGEVIELGGVKQVLWPDHCIQESWGAGFHPALRLGRAECIVRKGTDRTIDSYSAFFDNGHKKSTGLAGYLREKGVGELFVAGLATDYCVAYSARDALAAGFKTVVIRDACRGIDLKPGDVDRALSELAAAGVRILESGAVP